MKTINYRCKKIFPAPARRNVMQKKICPGAGTKFSAGRENGIALVEMMIAIVVISFLLIGIMEAMALCRRGTTAIQNQVVAASIAQELVDIARNQTYATLTNTQNMGTVVLGGQFINHSAGSLSTGLSYLNRPLVLDPANNGYSPQTWNPLGGGNTFNGTVSQTIRDLGNGSVALIITISWPNDNGTGNKQLVQSTVISQNGVHPN